MLISSAWAQSGSFPEKTGVLEAFVPLIFIFIIMYFLLFRPQQKKIKKHRGMINSLKCGDVVITSGGLVGKIIKVIDDSYLIINVCNGVELQIVKGMISEVVDNVDLLSFKSSNKSTDTQKGKSKSKRGKAKNSANLDSANLDSANLDNDEVQQDKDSDKDSDKDNLEESEKTNSKREQKEDN